MARQYRIVHEDFLVEWLGITYPPGTWRTNVRLGRIRQPAPHELPPAERRLLRGAFGAQADAIVLLPDEVHIIEAMVRHEPGALEDLIKYKLLFKETEEFRSHWNKPIRLILLTPLKLGFYEKLANYLGIEVAYYRPAWIQEYLNTYPPRFRRGRLYSVEWPSEHK